ncbi:MAG: DUF4163 domain-containing protein [Pseudobutyrivibrio sp.]|nr:DUF4163 domain-containing protein [Pseudobutyrivibrio sp.]
MKKYVSVLLAMTIAASAIGCGNQDKEHTKPQHDKEETVTEEQQDNDEVSIGASPTYTFTSVKYDDDYKYFKGKIECVSITDEMHPELQKAVDELCAEQTKEFNKACEKYIASAKEVNGKLAKEKEEARGSNSEFEYDNGIHYQYNIKLRVARCDGGIFTVVFEEYSFDGGNHGKYVERGYTFDSETGELIKDLDDYYDAMLDEIHEYLSNSPDTLKEKLKDQSILKNFNNVVSDSIKSLGGYLDTRGLTIPISAGVILPYSDGRIYFTLPYSKMEDLDKKYIPSNEFYTTDISPSGLADMIDVDGDGNEEVVYLETVESEEGIGATYTLHVGDKAVKIDDDSMEIVMCKPVFVHTVDRNYILVQASYPMDSEVVFLYDVDKGCKLVDTAEGSIDELRDGFVTLGRHVDAFGTWYSKKEYSYNQKGFSTDEQVDRFENNPSSDSDAKGITLKKSLTYYKSDGDERVEATLSAGDVIYPVATTGDELEFVTQDGETGYFQYETIDFVRYIDGVSEEDIFDGMPYVG